MINITAIGDLNMDIDKKEIVDYVLKSLAVLERFIEIDHRNVQKVIEHGHKILDRLGE